MCGDFRNKNNLVRYKTSILNIRFVTSILYIIGNEGSVPGLVDKAYFKCAL